MCKCTPEIRTPFCGKPGCEWPEQKPGTIQYIETLSLKEQFRLVEIAHETTDHEIRNLAVLLLQRYLTSPILMMARKAADQSQPNAPS